MMFGNVFGNMFGGAEQASGIANSINELGTKIGEIGNSIKNMFDSSPANNFSFSKELGIKVDDFTGTTFESRQTSFEYANVGDNSLISGNDLNFNSSSLG
jgi:hypothetical protein